MLADGLYEVLEEGKMLGKACKRRSVMLKTIFRLLDLESPKLLLKFARLILAVSESKSFSNTAIIFQQKCDIFVCMQLIGYVLRFS